MDISGGKEVTQCFFYHSDLDFYEEIQFFISEYLAKGNFCVCDQCKIFYISPNYVYIIEKLKNAGLLPQDYKKLCCYCYARNKRKRDGSLQGTVGRTEETSRSPEREGKIHS